MPDLQIGFTTDFLVQSGQGFTVNGTEYIGENNISYVGILDQYINSAAAPSFSGLTVGTLDGIIVGTSGHLSAITNNTGHWDDAYTHRLNTVNSTYPLSLSLSGNILNGSIADVFLRKDADNESVGVITAVNFISNVAKGTSPYTCTSTTVNTNLNADLLDDQEGSYYLDGANFTGTAWTDLTDNGTTTLHSHIETFTGDVTGMSATPIVLTIANDAVTYAKMQNVSATSRVLGRITAGAGDVEELTGANIATIANASFDHGTLTGLSDDDHTQYPLLLGRSGGQTLIGGTASGDDLTLQSTSHATKGTLFFDDSISMWPNFPDDGVIDPLFFTPSISYTATSGASVIINNGINISPAITIASAPFRFIYSGYIFSGTDTLNVNPSLVTPSQYLGFNSSKTILLNASGVNVNLSTFYDHSTIDTGNVAAGTASLIRSFESTPLLQSTGASATVTYSELTSFYSAPRLKTITAGGAATITTRRALWVLDMPNSGPGTETLTNNIGVDVDAMTFGGTLNIALRSAIASGSTNYALKLDGTAQSLFGGKITTYNNIATAGMGLPGIYSAPAISATKTANFTVLSYTPPASAGTYRVSGVITTTSSTNTGTVQFTLDYVDSQGTTHTADIIPLCDAAGAYATTKTGASKEFHSAIWMFTVNNSATAIVLKVVVTGSVSYTVTGSIEQII